jgi:hypothetical protein
MIAASSALRSAAIRSVVARSLKGATRTLSSAPRGTPPTSGPGWGYGASDGTRQLPTMA